MWHYKSWLHFQYPYGNSRLETILRNCLEITKQQNSNLESGSIRGQSLTASPQKNQIFAQIVLSISCRKTIQHFQRVREAERGRESVLERTTLTFILKRNIAASVSTFMFIYTFIHKDSAPLNIYLSYSLTRAFDFC